MNKKELARLLGVSVVQVNQLMAEGLPCDRPNGRNVVFDVNSVKWYYERKLERLGGSARARQENAKAELAEMELAERKGMMVPVADVVKVWEALLLPMQKALDQFPARASPYMVGLKNRTEAQAALDELTTELRSVLAHDTPYGPAERKPPRRARRKTRKSTRAKTKTAR